MTGSELKALREAYGISASAMGRALGYSGPRSNIAVHIRRLERGDRPIPLPIQRLATMFAREGIPKGLSA